MQIESSVSVCLLPTLSAWGVVDTACISSGLWGLYPTDTGLGPVVAGPTQCDIVAANTPRHKTVQPHILGADGEHF